MRKRFKSIMAKVVLGAMCIGILSSTQLTKEVNAVTTSSIVKVTSISFESGDWNKETATLQYNVTVYPTNATNKNVVWSSSNPSVIKIDATTGLATMVGKGETIITCKATDGSGVYKSISTMNDYVPTNSVPVTTAPATQVTTPPATQVTGVPVTGISISSSNWDKTTATLQYTATVYPTNATNKKVTWSSSNTNVALIDSTGKVYFIGKGSTVFTCTAADGSGVVKNIESYNGYLPPIPVNQINVTSISLSTSNWDKTTGTLQYNATVYPSNATNKKVVWSSSNPSVAIIDATTGKETLVGKGSTTITCRAVDGSGVYKSIPCENAYLPPVK